MRWLLAFAVVFGSATGSATPQSEKDRPGLVIVCARGGVQKDISHIASGSQCVLHDASGGSTSAGAISIYDDTEAVP